MQFADLLTRLSYLPPKDIEVLSRAYDAAASAHHDQNRLSGEKFIEHPLSVAAILADLQLDRDPLAASILHDTVEDTHLTVSDLEQSFGPTVGKLVAGVTKLAQVSVHSPEQAQAEKVRKMLVAMAEDVRVVLMKLADRLHNMRTVESLPEVRRRAMAQETLDIYAPLAHRLGMWNIKWELEDLSFAQLHPDEYREIVKKIARKRKERETAVNDIKEILERELTSVGIKADTTGRPKHVYSIASKLAMGKEFEDIYDLSAIRVLTDSIKDCYGALGVIHSLWKPIPGRFKDYIAMPRSGIAASAPRPTAGWCRSTTSFRTATSSRSSPRRVRTDRAAIGWASSRRRGPRRRSASGSRRSGARRTSARARSCSTRSFGGCSSGRSPPSATSACSSWPGSFASPTSTISTPPSDTATSARTRSCSSTWRPVSRRRTAMASSRSFRSSPSSSPRARFASKASEACSPRSRNAASRCRVTRSAATSPGAKGSRSIEPAARTS